MQIFILVPPVAVVVVVVVAIAAVVVVVDAESKFVSIMMTHIKRKK